MKNLDDIKILETAEKGVREVYELTQKFPRSEVFGITSQVQRAAVSVCANIAEGFYRNTNKDFINFLSISRGSAGETIILLKICSELKYIDTEKYNKLKDHYESLIISINSLIKYLKSHVRPNQK